MAMQSFISQEDKQQTTRQYGETKTKFSKAKSYRNTDWSDACHDVMPNGGKGKRKKNDERGTGADGGWSLGNEEERDADPVNRRSPTVAWGDGT